MPEGNIKKSRGPRKPSVGRVEPTVPTEAVKAEQAEWGEFHVDIEPGDVFRAPTPEQKRELDQRFSALADLMADADFYWQIDGGANVSLYEIQRGGDWVRNHKDIDLTVYADELSRAISFFNQKGFRLFRVSWKRGPGKGIPTHIPVSFDEALARGLKEEHAVLMPVDAEGMVIEKALLGGIDLHVMTRKEDGTVQTFAGDIPAAMYQGRDMDFRGKPLRLSHPALAALHKIEIIQFEQRPYDRIDLKYLSRDLTGDDVQLLESFFQSRERLKHIGRQAVEALAALPAEATEAEMTAALRKLEHVKDFPDHPAIKGLISDFKRQRARGRTAGQIIAEKDNRFDRRQKKIFELLAQLRQQVESQPK